MNKRKKYIILAFSWAFIFYSLTSLTLGHQSDVEKYGAGTLCDSCNDDCDYIYKYVEECFHENEFVDCLISQCIINEFWIPACSVNESGPNNCNIVFNPFGFFGFQFQMAIKCDTDDWSQHYKPMPVSFGECEYYYLNPPGRCFSNGYSYCECGTYLGYDAKGPGGYDCNS